MHDTPHHIIEIVVKKYARCSCGDIHSVVTTDSADLVQGAMYVKRARGRCGNYHNWYALPGGTIFTPEHCHCQEK